MATFLFGSATFLLFFNSFHCIFCARGNASVSLTSTELFDNYMQQDAHEFLNYLLNTIADLLQEEKSQERQQNGKLVHNGSGGGSEGVDEGEEGKETQQTWVHEIFQGTLTNETRCLNCEAVSGSRKCRLDLYLVLVSLCLELH